MRSSPLISKPARRVDKVCAEAFRFIGEKLSAGVNEVMVRDWILDQFRAPGWSPTAARSSRVNGHAGNPHYEPTP